MSKIAIGIKIPKPGLKIFHPEVQLVCRTASVNYQEAKVILAEGGIFYRTQLFMNDHVDVDEDIRGVLEEIEDLDIEPVFYELDYSLDWDDVKYNDADIISKSSLINILDEASGQFS